MIEHMLSGVWLPSLRMLSERHPCLRGGGCYFSWSCSIGPFTYFTTNGYLTCVQFLDVMSDIAMMICGHRRWLPGVYAPRGLAGGVAALCLKEGSTCCE